MNQYYQYVVVAWEDNAAYVDGVVDVEAMRARYLALRPFLDERQRRLFTAAEARAVGWGGVSAASRATGSARRSPRRNGRSRSTPRGKSWSATSRTPAGCGGRRASPRRCGCMIFRTRNWARPSPTGSTTLVRTAAGWARGIDHDTSAFAVNAIRSWWQGMGQPRYPQATRLVVTADSGDSNSTRNRLW